MVRSAHKQLKGVKLEIGGSSIRLHNSLFKEYEVTELKCAGNTPRDWRE